MGVRLPETMAGIHYLLFIFVSLYNIDNSRAFGDGACKGVTVGDCQLLDEYVIETLSIGISADLCQDICQQKTNCVVFQHSAENCTLLTEDYRQDCGTSGGPTRNPFDNCLGIELNTCDRFLEEECVYNGEVILSEEDIADAKHCQELCELFEDFGCEYWVYKENPEKNHHDCLLLHSDDRECTMTGGPKRPNFIECAPTTPGPEPTTTPNPEPTTTTNPEPTTTQEPDPITSPAPEPTTTQPPEPTTTQEPEPTTTPVPIPTTTQEPNPITSPAPE